MKKVDIKKEIADIFSDNDVNRWEIRNLVLKLNADGKGVSLQEIRDLCKSFEEQKMMPRFVGVTIDGAVEEGLKQLSAAKKVKKYDSVEINQIFQAWFCGNDPSFPG